MAKTELVAGVIGLGVGKTHIHGYDSQLLCSVAKICDFDSESRKQSKIDILSIQQLSTLKKF